VISDKCDSRAATSACGSGNGYSFTITLLTMAPVSMTLHKINIFQAFGLASYPSFQFGGPICVVGGVS
jgi:hypothetical protein